MINRLHHTGFVVSDRDKSVAFYRDVVGLGAHCRVRSASAPASTPSSATRTRT